VVVTAREIVWRYLLGGGVKHAFYQPPPVHGVVSARCGVGPAWFDPHGWLGARADQVGHLAELRECARCVDNLKRDRAPAS
jgi:hypothetical protein